MRHPLVEKLLAVRDGGPFIDEVPPTLKPRDVGEAYAIADDIVAALEVRWGPAVGYKIGATSTRGQQMLGLAEPFYGRAFALRIMRGVARWDAAGGPYTIEAEVGFVLAHDLPPRPEPYTLAEVGDAVETVAPLFEVNRPSFSRPFEVGGLCLIADNGVTQGLAVNPAATPMHVLPDLAGERVRMLHNGEVCAEGHAAAVLGNPLNALVWLANALRAQRRGLRGGDIVASGAMTPPVPMVGGDVFAAEYTTLGRIDLQVI